MTDTPIIRFRGFTDDWEQRKLGEILYSLQNNTLSRAELSTEQGIAKNVHYGDILVKFGEVLDVRTEQLPMIINADVVVKYKASFLQDGDVIVADTAEDETVGKCSEMVGVTGETVVAGLHTIPYRPQFHFASGYLGYYMNSTAYHQQLLPLMQGIKVTSISKSAMQNTNIEYPKSEDEQAKIGVYFRNLDQFITLHQCKCDETKGLKKYMLQKIFPRNGKKIPEIRFAGFTGDWEQRKLSECAGFRRGSFPQPYGNKEWYDGDGCLPFVQVADVGDDMKLVSDTKQKISKKAQPMSVFAEKDSVLVTLQGSIGRVAITQYGAFVDRTVLIFDEYKKNIDHIFWAYIIKEKFIEEAKKAPGGTIKTITKEALSGFEMFLPSIDEQKKIGIYLQYLDHLITLHQRKCDELKEVKKFMLQNMFPQKG